jgi:DtxR family transcriptional regulator, Mn-dependent transcriptional regulator
MVNSATSDKSVRRARRKGPRKLSSSKEDYLEAILHLVRRDRVARVRDIAARLGVRMPAVTAALKDLSARGLVNYDPYQVVTLTDPGREVAEEVSRRHTFLRKFLVEVLGLDEEVAEANACRMEHAVDAALLERLHGFAEFVQACPRAGEDWIREFRTFCGSGQDARRCRKCLQRAASASEKPGGKP